MITECTKCTKSLLTYVFILIKLVLFSGNETESTGAVVPESVQILNKTILEYLEKLKNRLKYVARSCKEIRDRYNEHEGKCVLFETSFNNVINSSCWKDLKT